MLSLLPLTSPCNNHGLKTLKQSMPLFLRSMPFKPSFNSTNHTVKLSGVLRPKPKNPATRISYTRHHVQPICSMANSQASLDLKCSLSIFYTHHIDKLFITRSVKPKIQGSSTLPWAFTCSLLIPHASKVLHVIPHASACSMTSLMMSHWHVSLTLSIGHVSPSHIVVVSVSRVKFWTPF